MNRFERDFEYDVDEYFSSCGCHFILNGFGYTLKLDECVEHYADPYSYRENEVFNKIQDRYIQK
jgi:hypothetical protein